MKSKAGSETSGVSDLSPRPVLPPLTDMVDLSWIGTTVVGAQSITLTVRRDRSKLQYVGGLGGLR